MKPVTSLCAARCPSRNAQSWALVTYETLDVSPRAAADEPDRLVAGGVGEHRRVRGVDDLGFSGVCHLGEQAVEVPLGLRVEVHLGLLDDDRADWLAEAAQGLEDSDDDGALHAEAELLAGDDKLAFAVLQPQGVERVRRVSEPEADVDVSERAGTQETHHSFGGLCDGFFDRAHAFGAEGLHRRGVPLRERRSLNVVTRLLLELLARRGQKTRKY